MENNKKCLVTQDLIGAVDWFLTAPDSIIKAEKGGDGQLTWKEKAKTDLYNKVNRIWGDFTEVAKRGVDFEKMVYKKANKETIGGSAYFQRVCELVKGYEFQKKGKLQMEIAGNDCLLYGKYDAYKPEHIRDIKTTAKYSKNKYLKGIQHKLYCLMEKIYKFDYVVVEWDEYPKIKAVHIETYQVEDMELLESEMKNKIEDCFENLKDIGLWDDYRNTYCMY